MTVPVIKSDIVLVEYVKRMKGRPKMTWVYVANHEYIICVCVHTCRVSEVIRQVSLL